MVFNEFFIIWNFIGDGNKFIKVVKVFSKYFNYLKWYWKNPEVKIRYSRIITCAKNTRIMDEIHERLKKKKIGFGDGFRKEQKELNFEIVDSKLSYRINTNFLKNDKMILSIENKYIPFYPLRRYSQLNLITTEFNKISNIVSSPIKSYDNDSVINIEIMEINKNGNEKLSFQNSGAKITFRDRNIQISNLMGTEHGEVLFYIVLKWLTEYRKN